jgi:hypothetical protein
MTLQRATNWGSLRSRTYALLFFLTFGVPTTIFSQSTNIAIGTTTIQPSVKRLGINLGTLDYYDSGQTTQNLLMSNPGFEGQIWNSTIRCASGTATSCLDEDQWSAWPAGFWNGATYEVFWGTSAGRTGTITSSTAAANGSGGTFYFSNSGVAPAAGDYLIVRKTVPGGASGGWWPSTSGNGKISDNLTDLPPGTLGKQTIALTAPTASDSAIIGGFFDSVLGHTFLQLNGTYQLQFKAKGIGGSNQIQVVISRTGVATYVSQPVNLTNSWNTYNINFSAYENGSAIGIADVSFATVGADSFELDDVSLVKTNGDPTNTTAFRDPVVSALRTLNPGVLRYWGGQLGDTLDNLLQPQFGRQRSGYLAWYTESDVVDYGLHDFLGLCQAIGAEPWFVVPSTFSTTDANNLIEYLAGASTSTYGAKRAALGQNAPWTSVFSKIHLEFGNEAWNGSFKGGSIEYAAPYGSRAQTIFGIFRSNPNFVAGNFDLVAGGQAAYAARNTAILNAMNNNDSLAVAPYTMGTVDSYSDNESLFGSTFAEPEAFMSSSGTAEGETPGEVLQDYQAIQASSHPVPMSFYEINMATLSGSISQQALNSYTPSLGAGLMVADTMLLSLRNFGVVNQELFALPQYNFMRSDGLTALLWGAVVDMGSANLRRPQFLALQLANQALSNGAAMLQTVHSGADPTWNQPLVNTVQFNGAHYLHSFAFANGSSRSAIVFNLSRSSALPVTFSGSNAPSGTVQMQQLTSAYPTDTNENSSVVNITASTLNSFNASSGLSLPPYSMTVLTWGGTTAAAPVVTPAPVISAVAASGLTTSSATITWTTDQASSSQVFYGTTTAYGSSSAASSSLTTTHSVTLTGLAAGTTYNFSVVSANSAGTSAASSNFTFATSPAAAAAPPPVTGSSSGAGPAISYVVSWGVSTSGITVSWSTSSPATTSLSYGTTTSLGTTTPVQSYLTVSHGVTLTGLASGTTYYFVCNATDVNGNSSTSTVYTFTTISSTQTTTGSSASASTGPPPQISYLLSWGITSNSASISWSTNVGSTTAVAYGTSTALGTVTPVQTGLTVSHGVVLNGLASGTTYYFVAQSTDSNGNTGYSATYSFTTGGSSSSTATPPPAASTPASSSNGPVLLYLNSWGVNASGISISWSTDNVATTAVSYGLSPALGQTTPVQTTLTNNHGVTLTGLKSSTTYYFVAQSTDANGNTGYSSTYSFTTSTGASGPSISAITVTPGSGNTAFVSWTTSTPTYSYVQFGPTTAYNQWSSTTSLTTNPTPAMGHVPSGVVHYQLVSTDIYGNQTFWPDQTFVEP